MAAQHSKFAVAQTVQGVQTFSKVPSVAPLPSKVAKAVTIQNFWQMFWEGVRKQHEFFSPTCERMIRVAFGSSRQVALHPH